MRLSSCIKCNLANIISFQINVKHVILNQINIFTLLDACQAHLVLCDRRIQKRDAIVSCA